MKKILYTLPLALIALVSCQKEEPFTGEGNAVTINATIGEGIPLSRVNSTENPATSWSDNDQIAINNEGDSYVTYTYDGTSWTAAPGQFLKWSAETMSFNGYHPVTEGTSFTDFTLPTDQSDLAKISAADYMTVSESKTKPTSGYGVDLNFTRKNARVIIKITKFNNEFERTPVISNLTVKSAHTSYTSGAVAGSSTAVEAYKMAGEDTYIALVIPEQTVLQEDFVNLDVTDANGTKSLKLSNIYATEAGKSYTYNLTVGKSKIEVNNVMVEDWSDIVPLPDGEIDADAGSVSIDNVDGQIILSLTDYTYANITSLSISGSLNAFDFGVIKLNIENLEVLDLSQTTITEVPANALNYWSADNQPGNTKLRKIILPSTVTTIGERAFQYCQGLISINLGGNVETFGKSIFYGCTSLPSIELPASVRTLGEWMFEGCSSLRIIKLNEGINTIQQNAFAECRALESINIPTSVKTLGSWMFRQCQSLKSITLPEGIGDIPASAFWGAMGLQSINIPASVTSIGNYAFAGCAGLEGIMIPVTVKSLGTNMFADCTKLKSAIVLADVTALPNNMFNMCEILTTCILNDKIQTIGNDAFAACKKLTNIKMPASLVSIGGNAFSNTALTSLVLPAGVSSIGKDAFTGSKIKNLTINSTVDLTIGHGAFKSCSGMNETMDITLPATLKRISCTSFYNNGILRITCHATTPPEVFDGDTSLEPNPTSWTPYAGCYLKVPAGSVEAYKAVSFWTDSFPGEHLSAIE